MGVFQKDRRVSWDVSTDDKIRPLSLAGTLHILFKAYCTSLSSMISPCHQA